MSFTVRDYYDLLQLLAEHPEWREQLRRALLSDDFLALPQIVRELAEAQKRTEERLEALAKQVQELTEAQKQTEKRVGELAQAQRSLAEELAQLVKRVDNIDLRLIDVERRLAKVDGRTLEIEYERKAAGYFGQILSRPRAVNLVVLEDMIPSADLQEQYKDLWNLDLLIQGRLRRGGKDEDKPEAWLAVEVSVLVDREDVERAKRRADLLRQAGFFALPVAAGEDLTERALQLAEEEGVIMVTDGRTRLLEQAIQKALTYRGDSAPSNQVS